MKKEEVRTIVRQRYAEVAKKKGCCCSPISEDIGYSKNELESVPADANMGLGCGNPVALASLKEGETVIDLGSGGGLDCFLAAQKVGPSGRIIGVDMTPEMIDKARRNARKSKQKNVEFRLGEIENLPVADNTADIIISNCVINLSPDKHRVFNEAYRTLKPGGRLMISDIVLLKDLPKTVRDSAEAYVGCLAGAVLKHEYIASIEKAGFKDVQTVEETHFPIEYITSDSTVKKIMKEKKLQRKAVENLADAVASVKVSAIKPRK
jgi:ubiquinone/menaquinone biosynthesis C-methylase UbiE